MTNREASWPEALADLRKYITSLRADLQEAKARCAALEADLAGTKAAVRAAECRRLAEMIREGHALNAAFHAAWIARQADKIEAGDELLRCKPEVEVGA